jgi:hypothetical protein
MARNPVVAEYLRPQFKEHRINTKKCKTDPFVNNDCMYFMVHSSDI